MQQRDEVKFAELMAVLAEVYDDGRPPSKLKMEVYFRALEQFDIGDIESAVKGLIYNRTTASFPKPAELIQEIRGTVSNQATMAWLDVLETVKRVGHYQSVKFSDPVIHSVIGVMGGWPQLAGEMLVDDEKWKQREFERLYEILSKNPRGKHPDYLPGLTEISNSAEGYNVKSQIIEIGLNRLRLVG
ncbi:MAG TPA: DUF6475 domain-containing protein [Dissulfurispiraceae bacterium]|nr:DUF6475 domain-containing protein [Dissulfurispiraceae bacterium]